MTPEEMKSLIENYGTPDYGRNTNRENRFYNVIVRTKDNQFVERHEMVPMKIAREIRCEARKKNCVADIIENTFKQEAKPNSMPNWMRESCHNIQPPRNSAMNTPSLSDEKAKVKRALEIERAQDNIARSRKNEKIEYHMYRVINKEMGIDIEESEERINDFLVNATNNRKVSLNDFTIIYVGKAYSWGKEVN